MSHHGSSHVLTQSVDPLTTREVFGWFVGRICPPYPKKPSVDAGDERPKMTKARAIDQRCAALLSQGVELRKKSKKLMLWNPLLSQVLLPQDLHLS